MLLSLIGFVASAQQLFISSSPDTVSWGDSACIVFSNHYGTVVVHRENITDGSWSDRDTLGLGSHWLCPSRECPGLNAYYLEWWDSTNSLWLGDTIIAIYWRYPYVFSPDTVTATSWSFTVTTTIPLRILLKDAGMTTIDSAIVTAPGGTVSWQGLQPQSTYHRIVYPDGGSVWGCDQVTIITDTLTTSTSDPISTYSVKVNSQSISVEDETNLIQVWDMNGQLLASSIGKVELDGLSLGFYLYRVFDSGGSFLATGKIIKTN